MTSKPLRDLIPGDVVDDYGTHRTVESTTPGRDPNGYPTVSVVYEDSRGCFCGGFVAAADPEVCVCSHRHSEHMGPCAYGYVDGGSLIQAAGFTVEVVEK